MILKSFLLGNLVSLCMKIINSIVVVRLYYGFLTTFSIGPFLFLPSLSSSYGRRKRECRIIVIGYAERWLSIRINNLLFI